MTTASAAVVGAMYIAGEAVVGDAGAFRAVDPADGAALEPGFQFADGKLVARAVGAGRGRLRAVPGRPDRAARPAARARRRRDRRGRRGGGRARPPRDRPAAAPAEGEGGRTTGQLRLFAAALREGSWNGARIDPALPDRKPARGRTCGSGVFRVGPVAVFARQQLPARLLGGRRRHRLGPRGRLPGGGQGALGPPRHLGARRPAAVSRAVAACGLPAGVFSLVYADGPTVGVALVAHPAIAAVGFTGSRRGGLALVAAAAARPAPIPVYRRDEQPSTRSSCCRGGWRSAAAELGAAFVGSLTLGAGQFCTNPGLVLAVDGPDLDALHRRGPRRGRRQPGRHHADRRHRRAPTPTASTRWPATGPWRSRSAEDGRENGRAQGRAALFATDRRRVPGRRRSCTTRCSARPR